MAPGAEWDWANSVTPLLYQMRVPIAVLRFAESAGEHKTPCDVPIL
jgi:hypothetical protein